jgi:hypothetical protein
MENDQDFAKEVMSLMSKEIKDLRSQLYQHVMGVFFCFSYIMDNLPFSDVKPTPSRL